jgi:DNA-binding transcriptional ArsR family regulator
MFARLSFPATVSNPAYSPADPDRCEIRLVHADRVAATRDRILEPESANRLAERFKLLADPARLRMVYALLEAGELCVCDLAATVGASESATSHQLRQLRLAGLVHARKDGRIVYYRIDDSHVRVLLDVAAQHYLHDHQTHP